MSKKIVDLDDAGVIEKDIHPSKRLHDLLEHLLNLSFLGDVNSQDQGLSARGCNGLDRVLQEGVANIRHRHIRAFLRQTLGNRPPNPPRGSRHQGHFVL
jgi:hypothetical protein